MKIFVKVKTKARRTTLTSVDSQHFVVALNEAPVDGRANAALCRLVGKYFNVPPSTIRIVQGAHRREKIVEVPGRPPGRGVAGA